LEDDCSDLDDEEHGHDNPEVQEILQEDKRKLQEEKYQHAQEK